LKYEVSETYINLALSSHSADSLTREERAQLTALLYTTVERKLTYDYYISAISGRSIEDIDPYTRNVLRLGICQILEMNSVPDFAAVNESVKLARNKGEAGFVNALLRSVVRQKECLPLPREDKNYRRYLSVKYSFPLWIVKTLDKLYGREATENLLISFNENKYTDLTVNTMKTTAEELRDALAEMGMETVTSVSPTHSIRIPKSVNPEHLPGFSEGHFFVQDGACVISALALDAKSGERVIDVCSCPGGKSFITAILMGGEGEIHSFDLHESKLSLIAEGADRLGIDIIDIDCVDATEPREDLFGKADKVICDAPCSGLGVLAKKPDLRYKSEESVLDLPELQLSILKGSAKYLRVGGEILYSTCTLRREENEEVVEKFLECNPEFTKIDFNVENISSVDGMVTLTPHVHNTDGFFMAKLKKTK
jgi:16S rRNA (cytosine967-C5)-methyltransferase